MAPTDPIARMFGSVDSGEPKDSRGAASEAAMTPPSGPASPFLQQHRNPRRPDAPASTYPRVTGPPAAPAPEYEPDTSDAAAVNDPGTAALMIARTPAGRRKVDLPVKPAPVAAPAPTTRTAESDDAPVDQLLLMSSAPVAPVDHAAGGAFHELTHANLVTRRGDRPRGGWRGALYTCSGGLINPGPSQREQGLDALRARVLRRLGAVHRVTVLSTKGGVGKTTTTAGLGLTLAQLRGDQVVVVDANPDAGTLAERLTGPADVTIRDLLDQVAADATPTSLDAYLSLAGRLRVLASQQDPAASAALTADEYERVMMQLARSHNIAITDCGTGIWHPTMAPALQIADSLIVVGTLTVDGATRAAHTLDWLTRHGFEAKARAALVVLSGDRRSHDVDAARVHAWFEQRTRAVVEIPLDPHLATGGQIDLADLRRPTRDAFIRLAALVADQFPSRPMLAA